MEARVDIPDGYRLLVGRPRTLVRLNDILQIDGNRNYSLIRFANGTAQLVAVNIGRMAHRLPEFVRIHRRHLVNPQFVQLIRTFTVANEEVTSILMTTGVVLPIARRRKHQVRADIRSFKKHGFRTRRSGH